jgi:hypothetical protein
MFRVGVVLLLIGMVGGIVMAILQDFTAAPAHAHLILVGFVLMFLVAFYYRSFPQAGVGGLAKTQATLHIIGAIIFPIGIAAVTLYGIQYEILAIIGSLVVLLALLLFGVIVFRTSQATA